MHTLPLDTDGMVKFFEDTDALYEIDYNASLENLGSPLAVLTYVANLGMTCALLGELDEELLVQYMRMKSLTDIVNLQIVHANILYYGKYGERLFPLDQFDDDETHIFCVRNRPLVELHMAFVNSTELFIRCQTYDPTAKLGKTTTNETFADLGFSILRLFAVEDFMALYMRKNAPLDHQIYFERYFEDKMFSGAPLMVYYYHPNNMYAGFTMAMSNLDEETLSDLRDRITQAISDDQFHPGQIVDSSGRLFEEPAASSESSDPQQD